MLKQCHRKACIVQDLFAPATHVLMSSNDQVCLPRVEASIAVASERAMLHVCGASALLGGHVVSSCIGSQAHSTLIHKIRLSTCCVACATLMRSEHMCCHQFDQCTTAWQSRWEQS